MTKNVPKKMGTLQFNADDTKVLARYQTRDGGDTCLAGLVRTAESRGKETYSMPGFGWTFQDRRTRVYKSVRHLPVHGPGSLNKFEQKRRLKEIIAELEQIRGGLPRSGSREPRNYVQGTS